MIHRSRRDGGGSVVVREGTKAVARKWLEWRYAIQPLMYDFDAALKTLYQSSAQPRWTRVVTGAKGRKSRKVVTPGASSPVSASSGYTNSFEDTLTLRLGILYRVNPNVQAFKRLGLLNPVVTLWELVPFSFIVDWFIPIGDYLSSLDAMAGVQVLSTWESRREFTDNQTTAHTSRGWTVAGNMVYSEYTASSFATKSSYNRKIGVSLAVPLPVFRPDLSVNRVTDAIALARSILGSK